MSATQSISAMPSKRAFGANWVWLLSRFTVLSFVFFFLSFILVFSVCLALPVQTGPVVQVDLASKTAWTFLPDDPGARARALAVPAGGWRLNGFPTVTSGTYERHIQIPLLPAGGSQTTLLAFEAVNWEAVVQIGTDAEHLHEAGRHLSAWTPFKVDISPYVTPGQTALVRVHVRDRNAFVDPDGRFTVPAATEWNDRQARGIIRGVALQVYPAAYISDVFVLPNTATNTLTVKVSLVNHTGKPYAVNLTGELAPATPGAKWNYPRLPSKRIVQLKPNEETRVTVGPLPWTPGRDSWWWPNVPFKPDYHAQLHSLTLTLSAADSAQGALLQHETTRFGFCTPGQTGNAYTLNGVRINLRGDSLPEGTLGTDAFERLPGFLPPSAGNPGWPGAVRNYQRLNYNVVRMHQVPATRYMLDVCDALGLLIIPETAIRGGGIKKENITVQPDAFTTHLHELVLSERNHPCVFKWSLENELFGAPEAFIHSLYETCREADGSRPCSIDDNADYPSHSSESSTTVQQSPNQPSNQSASQLSAQLSNQLSWRGFAVIEHYSQPAGAPDAAGGHVRNDRPYGQGEFIWPAGNTPPGPVWFGLETRAMRIHDNADIRPYTLIDAWPGVIPGLTPANFPNPHLPPDSLEQGGHSYLSPTAPWNNGDIQLIQRSFAPVAAFDRAYDDFVMPVASEGFWPAQLPTLPAGKTVSRHLTLFNDEFAGQTLEVQVQPTLRLDPRNSRPQPALNRTVSVPLGGHIEIALAIPVPPVPRNGLLELTISVRKSGTERYRETDSFVVVPEGREGSQAVYAGRDDKTQGNWRGIYGKEGFLIPIRAGYAQFGQAGIQIRRGTGFEPRAASPAADSPLESLQESQFLFESLDSVMTVEDPRVPLGGNGLTTRDTLAFTAKPTFQHDKAGKLHMVAIPLILRVDAADDKPHLLSLYCLDYKRIGRAMEIDVLDLQGHPLDSHRLTDFGNGAYVHYHIRGSVIVLLTSLTAENPVANGVFVDPDAGEGLLWHN